MMHMELAASSVPNGCYSQYGTTKLNVAMANRGKCSAYDKCACFIGPDCSHRDGYVMNSYPCICGGTTGCTGNHTTGLYCSVLTIESNGIKDTRTMGSCAKIQRCMHNRGVVMNAGASCTCGVGAGAVTCADPLGFTGAVGMYCIEDGEKGVCVRGPPCLYQDGTRANVNLSENSSCMCGGMYRNAMYI